MTTPSPRAPDLLARLAAGERVPEPVALVVAHPDDETVGLGGCLHLFDRLTLIHLTDGAPSDGRDARAAGFASVADYAAARAAELDAALSALCVRPERRVRYGLPDGGTAGHLGELEKRLTADLAGCAAVVTHPYEHGHPDHDSTAFAVQRACDACGGPARLEAAFYHLSPSGPAFGRFWPDTPETTLALDDERLRAKRAALACFASQAATLAQFAPEREMLRRAPFYRFEEPAPPGQALYEQWGLGSAAAWREAARAAMAG